VTIAPQLGWRWTASSYAITQANERMLPWLRSDALPIPPLAVIIERPAGDAALLCEAPKPRLDTLRKIGGLALQVLTAAPRM
jgi:hypothetical protein